MTGVPPRLDRNARLLGLEAMEKLARAHVVVLGLGGVGSFTAEALARAGVGRLTLVDGERVDETNANRQLHALDGEMGRFKAEVLAERLRRASPGAEIEAVCEPYGAESAERLVPEGVSFVVDAMDTVVAKLHVIARCQGRGIPIVTSMGAARRLDPTAVQVTDLAESHTDQLAKDVRKYLRRRHGVRASEPTGVLAVWSVEPPREDHALPGDERGIPGARRRGAGERRREPKAFGSVAFVTGVFGLAAAAAVVQGLTGQSPATPRQVHEVEQRRRRKRPARPR
ncbi:MAG TPA: tRNA threonylcarbamoyladenosine dehydratase [Anaeromyxobacteraceae bacterium]|nr:tRNA threonylcarbamoyladenosine dehydratase [Anaeromyxobacteraceae bacterium]